MYGAGESLGQVSICAGRLALIASSTPLVAVLGYAVGRTHGAATAMLMPGGAAFVVATIGLIVAAVAGGRIGMEGLVYLPIAIGCAMVQAVLLTMIGMVGFSFH